MTTSDDREPMDRREALVALACLAFEAASRGVPPTQVVDDAP